MIGFLRSFFGLDRSPVAGADSSFHPERFVYIMIPGDIQPLERGERFEDPLEDVLRAKDLGHVSGGGSQMAEPYPDGRPRVEFCGLDVDVTDRDEALRVIRETMVALRAPIGTELHYTDNGAALLDRLADGTWHRGLPRSQLHPGFGF